MPGSAVEVGPDDLSLARARGVVSRLQLILSLLRVPLAVTLGGADRERCALACAVSNLNFYFLIPKSLNPPQRDQLSGHRRSWQNRHGRGCRA